MRNRAVGGAAATGSPRVATPVAAPGTRTPGRGRMVRIGWPAAAAAALWLAAAAHANPAPTASTAPDVWWWRAPATAEVAWRGMLPTEGGAVGGGGGMLYPGMFGAGGLLVAILTHAAISDGVQSAERKRVQDEADKVLEPYAAALKSWPATALWTAAMRASEPAPAPVPVIGAEQGTAASAPVAAALVAAAAGQAAPADPSTAASAATATAAPAATAAATAASVPAAPAVSASAPATPAAGPLPAGPALRLWAAAAAPGEGLLIEASPVFTLSQDEGVLILDASVQVLPGSGAAARQAVVRVISSPHGAVESRAHWLADDARRLKFAAAAMLAHALHTAVQHGSAPPAAGAPVQQPAGTAPPMRTHRYLQGSVVRTERAQQLSGDCGRAVLRNLRGWLVSVPVPPAADSPCAGPPAF